MLCTEICWFVDLTRMNGDLSPWLLESVRTNTPTEASGLGFGLDSGVSVSIGGFSSGVIFEEVICPWFVRDVCVCFIVVCVHENDYFVCYFNRCRKVNKVV